MNDLWILGLVIAWAVGAIMGMFITILVTNYIDRQEVRRLLEEVLERRKEDNDNEEP